MTRLILLVPLLILAACATERTTYAPDGRKAYTLNCSGIARGWDKCFAAAGNICGAKGYDVIDRSDEPAAVGAASGSGGSYSAAYGRTSERSMVIACKP
jgi:hypothetical protein